MSVTQWRKAPLPNSEVVEALERALEAARRGHVRTLALVVVNPLHETETVAVGDLGNVGKLVLIGGLSFAANSLLQTKP